jgi:hypothetical protein
VVKNEADTGDTGAGRGGQCQCFRQRVERVDQRGRNDDFGFVLACGQRFPGDGIAPHAGPGRHAQDATCERFAVDPNGQILAE